jgi:hypothetical protein
VTTESAPTNPPMTRRVFTTHAARWVEMTALRARYEAGESVAALAQSIQRPESTVHSWLVVVGTPMRGGPQHEMSTRRRTELRRRYEAGDSLADLHTRFGLPLPWICRYLIQEGVALRPLGRPRGSTEGPG